MDVEDALRKSCDERRRKDAHIAGETDKVHARVLKMGDEVEIALGGGSAVGGDVMRGKA